LGAVQDIKSFKDIFDFFKDHTKLQLLGAIRYQDSNFNILHR